MCRGIEGNRKKSRCFAIVDGINQSVREPAEAAAAHTLAQRMPRLRKASDAARGSQHLNQERVA